MDSKEFEEQFAKARQTRQDKQEEWKNGLPPQKYQLKLDEAFRNVSQGGQGRPQVVFCWKVMEGEHEGKDHRQYFGLDNAISLEILDGVLDRFGFDTSGMSMELLDQICATLTQRKPLCICNLVKKGEYLNTRISEFMGFTEEEGDSTPEKPSEDMPWEVSNGTKVKFVAGDKTIEGEVTEVDEKAGTVNVTASCGNYTNVKTSDIVEVLGK